MVRLHNVTHECLCAWGEKDIFHKYEFLFLFSSPSEIVAKNAQHSMKRMESDIWMIMGEQVVVCGEVTMTLPKYSLKEVAVSLSKLLGVIVIN